MIKVTGDKLSFSVDPNRALDISALIFHGVSIGVEPPLGMLMTCGLENIGPESAYDKIDYPKHGSLRYQAAKDIQLLEEEDFVKITGIIKQSSDDGARYRLCREILYKKEACEIVVTDTVTNETPRTYPVFIMYHYNFGRPFLSEALKLSIPSKLSIPKDEVSKKDQENMLVVTPAKENPKPQGFFHHCHSGFQEIKLENKELGINIRIKFDGQVLPYVNQWKHFGKGQYVMALEPCNLIPYGRGKCIEKGTAQYLAGKESKTYKTIIKFHKNIISA